MNIQIRNVYLRVSIVVTTLVCAGLFSISSEAETNGHAPPLNDKIIEHLLINPDGNNSWPAEFKLVPVFQANSPVIVRVEESLSIYSLWHNRKKELYLVTRKQEDQLNREFMTLYFDPGQEGHYTDEQGWVHQGTGEFIKADVELVYFYQDTKEILDYEQVRVKDGTLSGLDERSVGTAYINKSEVKEWMVHQGNINDLRSKGYKYDYQFIRPWLKNPETKFLYDSSLKIGDVITRLRGGNVDYVVSEAYVRSEATPISFYRPPNWAILEEQEKLKNAPLQHPDAKNPTVTFPSVLDLNVVTADLLAGKFFSDAIPDDLLKGIFFSRWQYEKEQTTPIGGRYFNTSAVPPNKEDLEKELPSFREWLVKITSKMPNLINIPVQIEYREVKGKWIIRKIEGCATATDDTHPRLWVLKMNRAPGEGNFKIQRLYSDLDIEACKGPESYTSVRRGGSIDFGDGYVQLAKSRVLTAFYLDNEVDLPDSILKNRKEFVTLTVNVSRGEIIKLGKVHPILKKGEFPFGFQGTLANTQ